jgi:hypothetical protein
MPVGSKRVHVVSDLRKSRAAGDDFESFSRRWIRERLVTKSETYRRQVESRLERFVWPEIGEQATQRSSAR